MAFRKKAFLEVIEKDDNWDKVWKKKDFLEGEISKTSHYVIKLEGGHHYICMPDEESLECKMKQSGSSTVPTMAEYVGMKFKNLSTQNLEEIESYTKSKRIGDIISLKDYLKKIGGNGNEIDDKYILDVIDEADWWYAWKLPEKKIGKINEKKFCIVNVGDKHNYIVMPTKEQLAERFKGDLNWEDNPIQIVDNIISSCAEDKDIEPLDVSLNSEKEYGELLSLKEYLDKFEGFILKDSRKLIKKS